MEFKHKSVLLKESIEALQIKPDGIYVDGTLGGGGHSYEICRHLSDKGRLIGIDQHTARWCCTVSSAITANRSSQKTSRSTL